MGQTNSASAVESMVTMLTMLDRPKDLVQLCDQDQAAVSVVLAVAELYELCSHAQSISAVAEHLQETCTKVTQALAVAGAPLLAGQHSVDCV